MWKFKIDDLVRWSIGRGGSWHHGRVVHVLPAGECPVEIWKALAEKYDATRAQSTKSKSRPEPRARNHESYFVLVAKYNNLAKPVIFWPHSRTLLPEV